MNRLDLIITTDELQYLLTGFMYKNISTTVYIFVTEHIASDIFYAVEFTMLFCIRGVKHETVVLRLKTI